MYAIPSMSFCRVWGFLATGMLLLCLSCGGNNRPPARETAPEVRSTPRSSQPDTLQYRMISYAEKTGDCDAGQSCATVSLRYPEVSGTIGGALRDSLALYMGQTLFAPLYDEGPDKPTSMALQRRTPQTFTRDFMENFQHFLKNGSQYVSSWSVERDLKVVFNRPPLLTLAWSDNSYTGGAHPNYFQEYINFDTRSGRRLHIRDFIRQGTLEELQAIAERRFRQERDMPEKESWDELGFFFENGQFALNENFRIDENGLTFLFNPYEIAPYAFGASQIFLPHAEIKGLLRQNDYLKP